MKRLFIKIMLLSILSGLVGCGGNTDPSGWSSKKTDKWFEKGEYLNGWSVKPDLTIKRKTFAVTYFNNMDRWNAAFTFLKDNDLSKLELGRYDIDGNNLYVSVSEYITKNEEDAMYEAHQKYIDIQYVVSGKELIGIVPIASKNEILEPYDADRDIEFFTVAEEKSYKATPNNFFIFFPEDAHCPGLKDGENSPVRKIVVKVKVD